MATEFDNATVLIDTFKRFLRISYQSNGRRNTYKIRR